MLQGGRGHVLSAAGGRGHVLSAAQGGGGLALDAAGIWHLHGSGQNPTHFLPHSPDFTLLMSLNNLLN